MPIVWEVNELKFELSFTCNPLLIKRHELITNMCFGPLQAGQTIRYELVGSDATWCFVNGGYTQDAVADKNNHISFERIAIIVRPPLSAEAVEQVFNLDIRVVLRDSYVSYKPSFTLITEPSAGPVPL